MDILVGVILIAISIISSIKQSNDAKQKRSQRMQQTTANEKTIPRGRSRQTPAAEQSKQPQKKNWMGSLTEFLEEIDDLVDPKKQSATPAKKPPKATARKKSHKAAMSAVKKSPAELPKQTLMEQRPDREQREAHTKVSASVKPLKNAFENQEQCEHRIALNPNIQYSSQKKIAVVQQSVQVRTDSEGILQGLIWAEILGKPKAYQRRENRLTK